MLYLVVSVLIMIVMSSRQTNVNHSQKGKYESLHKTYEQSDYVEWNRNDVRHEVRENRKNQVVTLHVPFETKTQRKWTDCV